MMWLAPPVSSRDELGDVDARDGVGGHGPAGGDRPVAAVDQAGAASVRQAAGPAAACDRRVIVAILRAPSPP